MCAGELEWLHGDKETFISIKIIILPLPYPFHFAIVEHTK